MLCTSVVFTIEILVSRKIEVLLFIELPGFQQPGTSHLSDIFVDLVRKFQAVTEHLDSSRSFSTFLIESGRMFGKSRIRGFRNVRLLASIRNRA